MRRSTLSAFILACITALLVGMGYPFAEQRSIAHTASFQMLESHRNDVPIASGAAVQAPREAVTTARVAYGRADGRPIRGYLARPADATQPLPALIVIHEWWGLNDNIEMMTRRLAGEGYTALAVDLYGDRVASTPEEARQLVQTATQNPDVLRRNLRQAYEYLERVQRAPKIGSIGWCFGGTWSLNTALLLPDRLDAAVIYYGGQLETNPDRLRSLQMPILGLFGALDTNPSVETVRTFETALRSLNKPVEIQVYEGANHAFANPSGTRYNAEAAEDAWERTIAFLNEHLKS